MASIAGQLDVLAIGLLTSYSSQHEHVPHGGRLPRPVRDLSWVTSYRGVRDSTDLTTYLCRVSQLDEVRGFVPASLLQAEHRYCIARDAAVVLSSV